MFVDHVRFTSISTLASEATNIIHRGMHGAFYRGAGWQFTARDVSKSLSKDAEGMQ